MEIPGVADLFKTKIKKTAEDAARLITATGGERPAQSIVAITFSSMAIGVGRLLISTVVRHGWLSLKYSA